MNSYDRELRERLRRQREQARRAKWLNGELRHAIEMSHSSSCENQTERLHYIMGALSVAAGIELEELSRLLRGPEPPRPVPVVLPAIQSGERS